MAEKFHFCATPYPVFYNTAGCRSGQVRSERERKREGERDRQTDRNSKWI
jgi:hypothetical protein